MHSSTEVSMRDGWREEKKQGWEWDEEGIEGNKNTWKISREIYIKIY